MRSLRSTVGVALHWTIVTPPASISDLRQRLATQRYVADTGLAVSVFLALRLKRPLFIEGEAPGLAEARSVRGALPVG